jgi:hypothetical protein
MRTVLVLVLLVGLPAGVARADPAAVAAIQQRLAPFQALTGRFEQSKRIRVLSKPLVSSGDFVLLKDRGLIWRTTSPIQSGVRITPQGIAQLEGGKAKVLVSAKEQPGMSAVGKVLFAVFSLDLARLQQHFQVRSASAPEGKPWTAVLTPIDAGVARFVREISLSGGRTVDAIELTEANGDVTSIRFKDLHASPSVTPAQKALLE